MAQSYQVTVWKDLAEQTRNVAERVCDAGLRRGLLQIASGYDAIARRTEDLAGEYSEAGELAAK